MNREEKCELAIEKGITYDPISGKIFGVKGKEIIKKNSEGYILISMRLDKKTYYLRAHIFGWYYVNNELVEQIDHINHIRHDNRIENLRSVTNQENSFNKKDVKGYSWNKQKQKWVAYIILDYKQIHLGYYNTEEEARQAYLEAKELYHMI